MTVAKIPRESGPEWVPVPVTVVQDGSVATGVTIQYAVLARYDRPSAPDWVAAASDPGGSGRIGVVVGAVSGRGTYDVFVKVGDGTEDTVVLGPDDVGRIERT